MLVIIPMSGAGQRFVNEGYTDIKPLIKIEDKTIIEYIVELFDEKDSFHFIINKDHINTTPVMEVLRKKVPNATIHAIAAHKKGPVHSIAEIYNTLPQDEPCIVSYCDFNYSWNYNHFLQQVEETGCDGAIPCYTGFHPHLLHPFNIYATCKIDENKNIIDIKEKHSFTDDKKDGFHSAGTYYFKTVGLMKQYCDNLLATNYHLNGEFYVSMAYEKMLQDGLHLKIYDALPHLCQWGTPQDMEEYMEWHRLFAKLPWQPKVKLDGTTLLLTMAGKGSRFDNISKYPKPFIPIDGKPMYEMAQHYLPLVDTTVIVTLNNFDFDTPHKTITLNEVLNGQALTCLKAVEEARLTGGLLIAPCDNGMVYDSERLVNQTKEADVLVFGFRNASAVQYNASAYTWIVPKNERQIEKLSCKQPISIVPQKDMAITGAFWFKDVKYFEAAANTMIASDRTVNGEFYIDECINDCIAMGLNVQYFLVDHYIGWGTPNDVCIYNYWKSYFGK
jgi:NDP-sugar pyrophosphorylase family protein